MIYRKSIVILISSCGYINRGITKTDNWCVLCHAFTLCMSIYLANQMVPCCPRWYFKDIEMINMFCGIESLSEEENREKTNIWQRRGSVTLASSPLTKLLWILLVSSFCPELNSSLWVVYYIKELWSLFMIPEPEGKVRAQSQSPPLSAELTQLNMIRYSFKVDLFVTTTSTPIIT